MSALATSGSFCFAKIVLNEEVALPFDPRLNTLLFLVEIQLPLGLGEDSDPARPMCALYRPVDRTGGRTGRWCFAVGASAYMRTSLKMHCFCHLPGRSDYIPHIFLLCSLIMRATKLYETLNRPKIAFKFSSTHFRQFRSIHGILFNTNTKIILFSATLISPLKVLLTVYSPAVTRDRLSTFFILKSHHSKYARIYHKIVFNLAQTNNIRVRNLKF
jgi:hypothetical protein